MRRTTVVASVTALLVASLVPLSPASSAAAGDVIAPSSGSSAVVLGGGDGMSGPASRARVSYAGHVTLAADGTVLVATNSSLLRVDPASDQVSVVEPFDAAMQRGVVDVALVGPTTYLLTPWGLDRIDDSGERTRVWTGRGNAVDVGADGVAWVATDHNVTRVLADGTATVVPGTGVMDASDIAVTDSGSAAYVLDHAPERHGIYLVTADGIGARVAGTGFRDDSLREGQPATAASMESVRGISFDAGTISVTSGEYQLLATFPIGGSISVLSRGRYGAGVDSAGGTTVATQGPSGDAVVRFTAAATSRILGADPTQPWSPDGVLATDAYTDRLRGAASIDSERVVFVAASGMVREVDNQGRLRTRATLPPFTARGKVSVGPDGTAYVVNDAGRVMRVPASGSAQLLPLAVNAMDVEVLQDGRLVVADTTPARLVISQPDGTNASTLAVLPSTPRDLGLDGATVLVADAGLHRVSLADGSVTTLLSGGIPQAAARTPQGVWVGELQALYGSAMILQPTGGLSALGTVFHLGAQTQADLSGDVLVTDGDQVRRVTDSGAEPDLTSEPVTATSGEGRVLLTRDNGQPYPEAVIRAKVGSLAPTDPWDGEAVSPGATVLRIGGKPLVPGQTYTFAVFEQLNGSVGGSSTISYGAPVIATATPLPDETAPQLPAAPIVYADHSVIQVQYDDPSSWNSTADVFDFERSVVRMQEGTVAPTTPEEGVGLPIGDGGRHWVNIPNPVRDHDYALSIFTLDVQGNVGRWSAVLHLDFDPPPPVSDVTATPSYRSARIRFTLPAAPEDAMVAYAIAQGSVAPPLPADALFLPTSEVDPAGLSMDTTYTVALWVRDRAGNVSAPASTTFRTLLDATPPGPVTGLSAEGGNYSMTASWTNPTDPDFAGPVAELVDPETGTASPCPALNSTKTSCTWRVKGDATRMARVRSKDVNGNLSAPVEAIATTLPDSNGIPSIPEPVTWSADTPTTITVRLPRPTYPDLVNSWYVLRPTGEPTANALATGSLSGSTGTIARSITLPDSTRLYDLYLYLSDLNGNRGEKVLVGVHGGPDPAGRPSIPGSVSVTSPLDNTIKVTWSTSEWSAPVTEWVATATSADGVTTRTVRVAGAATSLGIADLTGRQSWSVRLYGVNDLGEGAASPRQSVLVRDSTAPAPVTALVSTPAYDTTTLRWANPRAFDLAKVVVTRQDRTSGAVTTLYSGTGTTARSTALVAGRTYNYELRSYDLLGNVSLPVTLASTQSTATLSVASTVRYGSTVRASGVLSAAGKALPGRTVNLFAQRVGTTTWSKVAWTTTSSTGAFALSGKPTANTRYRVGYVGSASTGGSYSATRTVTVSPIAGIKANRSSLYLGGTVTLSTTVSPNHAGRQVALQRWSGTAWVTLTWRTLSSMSATSATIKPSARGYNSYRWYLPAHTDHGSSTSPTLKVRVY